MAQDLPSPFKVQFLFHLQYLQFQVPHSLNLIDHRLFALLMFPPELFIPLPLDLIIHHLEDHQLVLGLILCPHLIK